MKRKLFKRFWVLGFLFIFLSINYVAAADLGDGSDGSVIFTTTTKSYGNLISGTDYEVSGNTLYLNLDRVFNFVNFTLGLGTNLRPFNPDGSGAAIYLRVQDTLNLSGNTYLNFWYAYNAGVDVRGSYPYTAWDSGTEDGIISTPSVQAGGGGWYEYESGGYIYTSYSSQSDGFGGGGGGGKASSGDFGFFDDYLAYGGRGGNGGLIPSYGAGGYAIGTEDSDNGAVGTYSAGGGGGASNDDAGRWSRGGNGGNTFGAVGSSGTIENEDAYDRSAGGGGGGAGGYAGYSGINLFIYANNYYRTGIIIVSGTDGQDGGRGGNGESGDNYGLGAGGHGGGGGGAGNSGNVSINYVNLLLNSGTVTLSGGTGGTGGDGGNAIDEGSHNPTYDGISGTSGGSGISGSLTLQQIAAVTPISPTASQTFNQDYGYALFNVTGTVDFNICYAELDNHNFTLSNSSNYWSLENSSMIDGAHSVKYYCNDSSNGDWIVSSPISFNVDSEDITECRSLTVGRSYNLLNNISNSGDCLSIQNSDISIYLNGYTIESSSQDAVDIGSSNYDGLSIFDGILDGNNLDINSVSGSTGNVITNVTYLGGGDLSNGEIYRRWYLDYKVNSSTGNLQGALVEIYDKDNNLISYPTTDSSGNIDTQILTEYVNSGGSRSYLSPYTINASKATYSKSSIIYNLTELHNVNAFATLSIANTAPTSTLSSPTDNSWSQSLSNDYLCSAVDSDGNLNNVTLYLWKGVTTLTDTQSISGSSDSANFNGFSATEDGTWKWNCLVYDSAGLSDWANSNRTIMIDTTNPVIDYTVNTQSDNANVSDNYIFVETSWTETNFNNITFNLYNYDGSLNDSTFSSSPIYLENWTNMADGQYYYNVTVKDYSGRQSSTDTYKITIDTQSPTITYSANSDAAGWKNVGDIFINVTAIEANPQEVWLYFDGANETFDNVAGYYYTKNFTDLPDGLYIFYAAITDVVGNYERTIYRTIRTDTNAPLISFGAGTEVNNSNVSQSNIYFDVDLTEINCDRTLFYWREIGSSWNSYQSATCGTTYNKTGLTDGSYQYYVFAEDNALNSNQTEIRTITLDSTPPEVNIISPQESDVYSYHNQSLLMDISDNLVGLDTCIKNLNSQGNVTFDCSQNSTVNSSLGGTVEGTNTLEVWVNDTLGNTNYQSISFGVSTTSPAITLDFPESMQWLNYGDNIYLNFTATDAQGVDTCQVWGNWSGGWHLNYSISSVTSGVQNYITINIPDGNYKWNVWCNDTFNNNDFSLLNKTFNVDTVSPTIEYIGQTKSSGLNVTDNFIFMDVDYFESNIQSIIFSLYKEGVFFDSISFDNGTSEYNFTNLDDGRYSYQVNITDKSENENNTEIRTITLDNGLPAINIISPENDTYNYSSSQIFNVTFSDSIGIKNATLYVYDSLSGLENMSTFNYGYNITNINQSIEINLGDGIKTWFYKLWDWSGNSITSENSTITIDSVLPDVVAAGYYPDTIYTETPITIYGNITDTNLDSVWIEINSTGVYQNFSSTSKNGIGQYIFPITSLETSNNENVSWRWWAQDLAGNKKSSSLEYLIVQNRNPYNVEITSPDNNSYINNSWFYVNFSALDEDVDELNYSLYYSDDGINFTFFNSTTEEFMNFSGFNYTNNLTNYFYIIVSDGYLTNQSDTYEFIIDSLAPTLEIFSPLPSPAVQCNLGDVYLNISVEDDNLDYCTYQVIYGELNSTQLVTFNCSPTYFDVTFDDAVQLLTINAYDIAGNVNTSSRYLYFNSEHSSCGTITPPNTGGGGGVPNTDIQQDFGFCGDSICQDGKLNTSNRGEDFYNCPVDCAVIFTFDNFNFDTLLLNCLDDTTSDKCLWKTNPGLLVIFIFIVSILIFTIFFEINPSKKGTNKIIYISPFKSKRKKR